jgi:hypothetical protein
VDTRRGTAFVLALGALIIIGFTKSGIAEEKRGEATPSKPELCTAEYHAVQAKDVVVLIASGTHAWSGYKDNLERDRALPPNFTYYCAKPSGQANTVVTPFQIATYFTHAGKLVSVNLNDADNPPGKTPKKILVIQATNP